MSIKMSDIVQKLNISTAAVSLAINHKPGVSEDTRKMVLKTCREMGYRLNSESRNMMRRERSSRISNTIRLVLCKKHGYVMSDTPFFSALLEGIDTEARKFGYNVLYSYYQPESRDPMAEASYGGVSGLIVLATEMFEEDVEPLLQADAPKVVLDAYFPNKKADTVLINNFEGAYDIVEHLIGMGHTRIGHLKSAIIIKNFTERERGFHAALAKHGLSYNSRYDFNVSSTIEGAYRDMCDYLERDRELPTAFFADNDNIAYGAFQAFKAYGISMPEQVSLVGFDDIPICETISSSLTTVRVFKQNMGRMAVQRLVKRIEGEGESDEYNVIVRSVTETIVRSSVKRLGL